MRFALVIILFFCAKIANAYVWRPELKFFIEDGGYEESLTFISGFSYAMQYVGSEPTIRRKGPLFCGVSLISSKELIEIGNKKLRGRVSSEEFSAVVVKEMVRRHPCT